MSSSSIQSQSFWMTGKESSEIRSELLVSPCPGEVLIESKYSGISRGTESLIYRGLVPRSEFKRMQGPHQEGSFDFPLKYGYANVGVVCGGESSWVGQSVFCMVPHQTHYVVPTSDVIELPKDVSESRAILSSNMETALNGVWDAQVSPGDRVAIVGAGCVGSLVAYLVSKIPGSEVVLVDVNPDKKNFADQLGIEFADPSECRGDSDVVFHASGNPKGIETAMGWAANETTIVEMSWYGDQETPVPLGGVFHSKRLHMISSQVGQVSSRQRSRWSHRRRLEKAISFLVDPVLDGLIESEISFSQLPSFFESIHKASGGCHRVVY